MQKEQEFSGIERETGPEPSLSIIWLHGLGADASDFLPIVDELELPQSTRFVFPNAPLRPITINGGMVMRGWFDIRGFGPDAPEDTDGLAASVEATGRLVAREIGRGQAPHRIVLAGFSQGGAVALHAGLSGAEKVGGILGLSTYLPAPSRLAGGAGINRDVPVWLAHGSRDPILPLALAESGANYLRALGVAIDWSVYTMAHEVCFDEITAISAWLRRFASD